MQATDSPWRAGLGIGRTELTTTYAVVAADIGKVFDCTGVSPFTVSLPALASLQTGFFCAITNRTFQDITIDPAGAEQIISPLGPTLSTLVLQNGQAVTIMKSVNSGASVWTCFASAGLIGSVVGGPVKLITATAVLAAADIGRTVFCSATPYTVTLPNTGGAWSAYIYNTGSGELTLAPVGGQIQRGAKHATTVGLLPGTGVWAHATVSPSYRTLACTPGPIEDPVVTLADAATIATDASQGSIFEVTLTASRTLGAPTNPTSGQKAIWRIKQDGTGGWTLAYNAVFRFSTSVPAPVLSTAINTMDMIGAVYNATDLKWDVCAVSLGYA